MKVFYDTEFSERGPAYPIILISIGLVREDGQTLYCINKDFALADCNDWVKAHVLTQLEPPEQVPRLTCREIAEAVKVFAGESPEFWAYVCAYDHIVLMQTVWGVMADKPEHWPNLTLDVKQLALLTNTKSALPPDPAEEHNALVDAHWTKQAWEAVTAAGAQGTGPVFGPRSPFPFGEEDEQRRRELGWHGADFDGTLAYYDGYKGDTHLGEPIPLMLLQVKAWLSRGERVKIFTARADKPAAVRAIQVWCQKYGLPALEVTNVKDSHMIDLWDDRAVGVVKNTGQPIRAVQEDGEGEGGEGPAEGTTGVSVGNLGVPPNVPLGVLQAPGWQSFLCPSCGYRGQTKHKRQSHCPDCGQRLRA